MTADVDILTVLYSLFFLSSFLHTVIFWPILKKKKKILFNFERIYHT